MDLIFLPFLYPCLVFPVVFVDGPPVEVWQFLGTVLTLASVPVASAGRRRSGGGGGGHWNDLHSGELVPSPDSVHQGHYQT